MLSVVKSLCELIEASPPPDAHVSSHWRHHGAKITAQLDGEALCAQASGFDTVARPGAGGRLLHLAERWSYRAVTDRLASFPSVWRITRALLGTLGGGPDFHAFKSACVVATLSDHWQACGLRPRLIALIGDGDGLLGVLIRRTLPGAWVYCIDLPKALAFQAWTHHLADPAAAMAVLADPSGARDTLERDIVFVPPQAIEAIPGPVDCAINVASMQEMTRFSIEGYFRFLRRRSGPRSRFYCVNRARKTLRDGEVNEFAAYPWQPEDEVFLDGPCPYYTHYVAPATTEHGPRVLGLRLPCINGFEGPVMHRLTRLVPPP